MLKRTGMCILTALLAAGHSRAQEITVVELGRKALETTLSLVKDGDPDVRGQAAMVLGKAGNPAAAGVLRKMLADADKHVRINAALALWELGDSGGLKTVYAVIKDAPSQGAENDSPLLELRRISRNKVREHAIEALASMRGRKAADMLSGLKNDGFGLIRDAAARELARLGYNEELSQFLDALDSGDEAVRYEGALSLGKICAREAAERLRPLLARENPLRLRMAGLDAVRCSGDAARALPELIALADDPNPTIRFKAIGALGAVNDRKALEKLRAIYSGSNDISLKIAALTGLVNGGEEPDDGILARAFDSGSQDVKLEALRTLRSAPDEAAKKYFLPALKDESVPVRLGAALEILTRFARPAKGS